jgi:hypothetical protein
MNCARRLPSVNCRNISIARFDLKKGEQAAQACANADYVNDEFRAQAPFAAQATIGP